MLFFWGASLLHLQAQELPETTTDFLGYYLRQGHSAAYQTLVRDNGAKVVNLQSDSSFFVVWVPQNYSSLQDRRVMVCVHGTAGTGYAETRDELNSAKTNNYALVGIQWVRFDAQNRETYFPESKVYTIIDAALKHMKAKYSAEVNKVAYKGFSRGSLISYEVTYLDRSKGTNYFALTMGLSGGQSQTATPGKYDRTIFMDNLEANRYGTTPFAGASFFLYCGLKDEQWDTLQAKYMRYTAPAIQKYAANITRLVIDPDGKHAGYSTNTAAQNSAMSAFMALTSTPPVPILTIPSDKAVQQPLVPTLQWTTSANAAVFDIHLARDPIFSLTQHRDSAVSGSVASKIIPALSAGTTYYWRVRSKNNVGASAWSDTRTFTTQGMTSIGGDKGKGIRDDSFSVSPNPAQERITVSFTLPQSERVSLKVFNILGQEIAQILDETLPVGEYRQSLDIGHLSLVSQTLFVQLKIQHLSLETIPLQVMR